MMPNETNSNQVDAAYLYSVLAEAEKDKPLPPYFRRWSEIEPRVMQFAFLKILVSNCSCLRPLCGQKFTKNVGKVFVTTISSVC